MSNKLNGIDTKLYYEILKIVPNLHSFLIQNNIVFEYVLCLNYFNRSNRSNLPFNYSSIKLNPKSVITYSFDWAEGNDILYNNNIQTVSWRELYGTFYTNYHLYSYVPFNSIKII